MANSVLVSKRPPCDYCKAPAYYDGKTKSGPWANMCDACWRAHGVGKLGVGLGQRLEVRPSSVSPRGLRTEVR